MFPIVSPRLVVVTAIALFLVSMAPAATAQVSGLSLAVSPALREAPAGGTVEPFLVSLKNTGALDVAIDLAVTEFTPGWTFQLANATLVVPAGGFANTSLAVFMPSGATEGQAALFKLHSYNNGTKVDATEPASMRVNVTAPAAAPAAPAPSAPRPDLGISAAATEAAPGQTALGKLVLVNREKFDLNVRVSFLSGAWGARVDGPSLYTLKPGATREVPLLADVPADSQNGTERSLALRADIDGELYESTWLVRSVGEPVSDSTPSGSTEGTTTTGGDTAGTEGTDARPAVSVKLTKLLLEVAPGATERAILTLANPTTQATTITLDSETPAGWVVEFEERAVFLDSGAKRDIAFTLTAPADAIPGGVGTGAILATPEGQPTQRAAFSLSPVAPLFQPADIDPVSSGAAPGAVIADDKGELVPVAIGFGVIGAGAVAFSRRSWREKLMWGGVGLYTRLLRPDILRHEEREKLHVLIGEQPGIHFHALQRELGWNTGTLTYHVRVLERHSFITSRRDGQMRRFYQVGAAPKKETFDGPSGLRADVLEAVQNQPGISQSDVTLALGANKQTVNYHVKALERQGLIRVEKRGRDTFLYVVSEIPVTRSESASA